MASKPEETPNPTPSSSTAGKTGDSSSKALKCEGKVVSSTITRTLLKYYKLAWETTLKLPPGEKYITSKRFVIDTENENESHWRMELDPNFIDTDGTRYLSAYVVLEKSPKPKSVFSAFYHFNLMSDTTGNSLYVKYGGISKFSAEKPSYGFTKFISFAQLGKFADPNNNEKLIFGVTLQILEEIDNLMEQDADIEEAIGEESDTLPFDPKDKPIHNAHLRFGPKLVPVDSTRVNYFTDFFLPYYLPQGMTVAELAFADDMQNIFGSEKKFQKLLQFCHECNIDFPHSFEGLIGIMDMAESLLIAPLRDVCEHEMLNRLDITNFVKIVELTVGKRLNAEIANPVIWRFMIHNIYAVNNCKEFRDTYSKYKPYYEALMVQDDPSEDVEDGVMPGIDEEEDFSDLYS